MVRQRGFTLIELMIVVAIIAVVAAIAIPNLLSARLSANETAAIGTLRELISAQAAFQKRGLADQDADGLGEFGTFAEMSGGAGVRGGPRLVPAVLASSFQTVNADGETSATGYQYRIFLPDIGGDGLGELAGGGSPAGVDPDLAESVWCCYAWPTNYEQSGVRTFFTSHNGEVLFAAFGDYSGPGNGPGPGAALRAGGTLTSITGVVATGTIGRDGNLWRNVGN